MLRSQLAVLNEQEERIQSLAQILKRKEGWKIHKLDYNTIDVELEPPGSDRVLASDLLRALCDYQNITGIDLEVPSYCSRNQLQDYYEPYDSDYGFSTADDKASKFVQQFFTSKVRKELLVLLREVSVRESAQCRCNYYVILHRQQLEQMRF
jgi:hypothetical protein